MQSECVHCLMAPVRLRPYHKPELEVLAGMSPGVPAYCRMFWLHVPGLQGVLPPPLLPDEVCTAGICPS